MSHVPEGATGPQEREPGPEFVMPAAVEPPAARAVSAPSAGPIPDTAPDTAPGSAPDAAPDTERRRMPWRAVAMAVAVGVLVGAAIPTGIRATERAIADADAASLRSTAMAYLTAIAEREADVATAMVPSPGVGVIAPDAVLRAAAPIAAPEVRLVAIDGDSAIVDVQFELGSQRISRTLDADRADGGWRLATTLAEPVAVPAPHWQRSGDGVRIGGVTLEAGGGAMLYPGRYQLDVEETSLLRIGGDAFEVDGDPATPVAISASTTPSELLADAAVDVAHARVGDCQLLAECPIDVQTVPRPADAIHVTRVDSDSGAIDLLLPLGLGSGFGGSGEELQLRALVDDAGALAGWQCSDEATGGAFEPCGP